jgi:hypothetical protein
MVTKFWRDRESKIIILQNKKKTEDANVKLNDINEDFL